MTSDERHSSWQALLQIAAYRRSARTSSASASLSANGPHQSLLTEPAPDLFALYAHLAAGSGNLPGHYCLAHLGQSIDGCIATESGHSLYVTGQANLVHLHRLRALSDAIIVGKATVAADDPRLTTRLVDGPSPVRVILDKDASLSASHALFSDQRAQTLVVCAEGQTPAAVSEEQTVRVPVVEGQLSLLAVRDALSQRGLRVLFVEGGGVTVTRFVQSGLLDRLHIAIAPVLIGLGRRGIALPSASDMPTAVRPPARLYRMGEDILWDLDLSAASGDELDIGDGPVTADYKLDNWPHRVV